MAEESTAREPVARAARTLRVARKRAVAREIRAARILRLPFVMGSVCMGAGPDDNVAAGLMATLATITDSCRRFLCQPGENS